MFFRGGVIGAAGAQSGSDSGFTPFTPDYTVSVEGGVFAPGAIITITKSTGGFSSRPEGFPVPLHFDTVEKWYNNGVVTQPYAGLPLESLISVTSDTPYESITNMHYSTYLVRPGRSVCYKSFEEGSWTHFKVDQYKAYPASREVNKGTIYHRFWLYLGPSFYHLPYAAPEKYLRIWDGASDTNLRTTMDIYRAPATGTQLSRSVTTRLQGSSMNSPNPDRMGWNLIEHFFEINGVVGETISRSRINSDWSVNTHAGGQNWSGWPLTNGATPKGSIWDGNAGATPNIRTGSLVEPGKWLVAGDIYSDITPQRIEIGESAGLYTLRGKRNLLFVRSWSDSEITAEIIDAPYAGDALYWVDHLDQPYKIGEFTNV